MTRLIIILGFWGSLACTGNVFVYCSGENDFYSFLLENLPIDDEEILEEIQSKIIIRNLSGQFQSHFH